MKSRNGEEHRRYQKQTDCGCAKGIPQTAATEGQA